MGWGEGKAAGEVMEKRWEEMREWKWSDLGRRSGKRRISEGGGENGNERQAKGGVRRKSQGRESCLSAGLVNGTEGAPTSPQA